MVWFQTGPFQNNHGTVRLEKGLVIGGILRIAVGWGQQRSRPTRALSRLIGGLFHRPEHLPDGLSQSYNYRPADDRMSNIEFHQMWCLPQCRQVCIIEAMPGVDLQP